MTETLREADQNGQGNASGKLPPTLPMPDTQIQIGIKEREWLRGPLGRYVNYRLIVNGNFGPKEITKLIRLLEAQRAVLSDENADDALAPFKHIKDAE